ncbi:hypothetical protein BOX30_04090 [Leptospirillum ferriphilum]|uniref:Uncharacterized protein n=1 Tax=Leptospirillum ferriphilum YSK TaxID=1441628 RepID=A0A059XXJ3_9BACT|nr:hypothetical protein Y981_08350 [Leptospirillum ferriphilum YSK]OOH82113.1 hypothetical protein BOX30_04090 [Leptospirillum ferriphilum]
MFSLFPDPFKDEGCGSAGPAGFLTNRKGPDPLGSFPSLAQSLLWPFFTFFSRSIPCFRLK